MHSFPKISLLITHYNRSRSLENLLRSFHSLGCVFNNVVVSDDGSKSNHLQYIERLQKEYSFQLVSNIRNRGLGNNINKGQDVITTPYTLYVQEDFEPTDKFPERLEDALSFFEGDDELDYIRFYAYYPYPYLKPFDKGFSKMYIRPFAPDYRKIYYYSDHPHLRRSSFLQKFGRYAEGLKGDRTEYRMCISFIQNKGQGLFYNECKTLFNQKNTSEEPSTMLRVGWRQSNNLFIKVTRDIYRQVKFNYDILMMKPIKKGS